MLTEKSVAQNGAPASAGAGTAGDSKAKGRQPNPKYAAPPPPMDTNPLAVHKYYMDMSTYHHKQAGVHGRLRGLKPLWSDARNEHDDLHNFHKAMRDGFAQKALAVDIAAPQQPAAGAMGAGKTSRRESIEESCSCPKCGSDDTHPVSGGWKGVKMERCHSCGHAFNEAFSGTSPTGAMNTVNSNKAPNLKVLQPKPAVKAKPVTVAPKFGGTAVREAIEEFSSNPRLLSRLLS